MMGVALEQAVKKAMRNHVYTFNSEVRRQSEGGAIGNKLTGAMAKVYMSRWTRQLKCNLAQATEYIKKLMTSSYTYSNTTSTTIIW